MGPSDLIQELLGLINFQEHLRKTQPDWETRWENVKEVITFAREVEEQGARDAAAKTSPGESFQDEFVASHSFAFSAQSSLH